MVEAMFSGYCQYSGFFQVLLEAFAYINLLCYLIVLKRTVEDRDTFGLTYIGIATLAALVVVVAADNYGHGIDALL
jgi:hypothetical protein